MLHAAGWSSEGSRCAGARWEPARFRYPRCERVWRVGGWSSESRPLDQVRVNRRRIYTSGDGKPQVRRPKSTIVYDYTALQRSSARNRSAAAAQLRTTLEQARVPAEKAGDLHQRLAVRIGR